MNPCSTVSYSRLLRCNVNATLICSIMNLEQHLSNASIDCGTAEAQNCCTNNHGQRCSRLLQACPAPIGFQDCVPLCASQATAVPMRTRIGPRCTNDGECRSLCSINSAAIHHARLSDYASCESLLRPRFYRDSVAQFNCMNLRRLFHHPHCKIHNPATP